jgi:hypothetical protein
MANSTKCHAFASQASRRASRSSAARSAATGDPTGCASRFCSSVFTIAMHVR